MIMAATVWVIMSNFPNVYDLSSAEYPTKKSCEIAAAENTGNTFNGKPVKFWCVQKVKK